MHIHCLRLLIIIVIVTAVYVQSLHHKLTKRELQHVFGVEEKHQVPEYSLINAHRVYSEDGGMHMRFTAWNDTFLLHLKPNTKLISPHLVSIVRNGTEATEFKGLPYDYGCHFQGKVLSHDSAPAAVSDCRLLAGTLVLPEHFLVLQTVPKRVQHLQEERHLVFKRSASLLTDLERNLEEEIVKLNEVQEPFCDTSESVDDPSISVLSLNYSIPSSANLDSPFIFPNMDPITLEIGLFLDSKLYEHFQREFIQDAEQHLLDFSLALINNVHVLYQQPTLSPNLEIVIVRYEMWKSQPTNLATIVHKNGQAQGLLDAFCRHQAHINPGTDLTDNGHWDHGVLLTGYDIYHTTASVAGVAPVARMCDPLFACSLVEGLHLGRSFVLAHEMGHNMGMVHDGVQNQCSRSCCLMSAVNGAGKTTWSECSVREFNAFLLQLDESGRGNCLRDSSPGLYLQNHLTDGRVPGQRFTADQQCAYFWGRDYQVEIPAGREMDDICRILWCGNSGSTISTAHPALEGSWCGNGKWCHEGHCSPWPLGLPPSIVDGGWSDWSNGEKRCPVAQCQVTGSITLNAQHRDCVNPAPNNGGRQCQGASIRGIVCGTRQSNCQGYSREEFSDRVCSSIKHDPIKPDRQLTGEGFEHSAQPCRVWCHLIDSELIRNKGQFPDGAPCGFNQFCVSGTCLSLGCDDKAAVDNDEDCPNVQKRQARKWDEWSPWSDCSATCGKEGHQLRKRNCLDSLPSKCKGAAEEYRACLPAPPSCAQTSDWGKWSRCSSECGDGEQRRQRVCLFGDCQEPMEQKKSCNRGGCWDHWQDWSPCSQSCGGGQRRRDRTCPTGDDCRGDHFQTEQCNVFRCSHEAWGDWLPCSVSCGIGFQIRERLCDGILCPVANKQARTCNEQPCPASSNDYEFGEWGSWGSCSSTCGEGTQTKTRSCNKGSCPSSDSSRTRRCVLRPCPVWRTWSEWTACVDCSQFHTRTRTRQCGSDNFDGSNIQCEGSPIELETCDRSCDPNNEQSINPQNPQRRDIEIITRKGRTKVKALGGRTVPIDEVQEWGGWSEWSQCTASCGGGSKRRSRLCLGEHCPEQPLQAIKEPCNEQNCEDDQNWSEWSDWGACSVSCGEGGTQSRSRRCTGFFLFRCSGSAQQTRGCENAPACSDGLPENTISIPTWSPWSSWSVCSCFTLTESRRRFCRVADPAIQGFCPGPILDQRKCTPASCMPSPGGWSEWSSWSVCSKDCKGTGHQIRNRMCSEPVPANRGAFCAGYSFDQRVCQSEEQCKTKVDGAWSEWGDWSSCSDPCTNGHKSRTRFCSNPRPSQGGLPCFGSDFELQPCSEPSQCGKSVDGAWGEWTPWSECPSGCGFALQSRHRFCDSPSPSGGGQWCTGLAYHTTVCNTEFCNESIDGDWSAWNEWSPCVANCGIGSRTRIRACVSPAPSSGGAPCFGRSSELEECREEVAMCSKFIHYSTVVDSDALSYLH